MAQKQERSADREISETESVIIADESVLPD